MSNTTRELEKALQRPLPPEHDQEIIYSVETLKNEVNVVHGITCPRLIGAAVGKTWRTETTGGRILESLGADQIGRLCAVCWNEPWAQIKLLLDSSRNLDDGKRKGQVGGNHNQQRVAIPWANYALMLGYETWKPGRVDEWCQWLCGSNANQLRTEGRQLLGWDEEVDEAYEMIFETDGLSETNWMLGLGAHRVVASNHANGFYVHGLIPERVADRYGTRTTADSVSVGYGFGGQHFEVAVNLYETGKTAKGRSVDLRTEAVQTAKLCLA